MIRALLTVDPGEASGLCLAYVAPRHLHVRSAWSVHGRRESHWMELADAALVAALQLAAEDGVQEPQLVVEVPPEKFRRESKMTPWQWFKLGQRAQSFRVLWHRHTGVLGGTIRAGWAQYIGAGVPRGKRPAQRGHVKGEHRIAEAELLVPGAREALAEIFADGPGNNSARERLVDVAEACLMARAVQLRDTAVQP
jgi:hypothetical protein